MAMTTTDLYKVHLKHREAYLLYLAKGATDDITVLPEPLTDAEHDLRVAEMPVFAEYNESNWLDVLPDELKQRLSGLPKERLRAFYLYRVQRYTQKEIAVKFHKSQVAVHFWIKQITEIIENYKSNL